MPKIQEILGLKKIPLKKDPTFHHTSKILQTFRIPIFFDKMLSQTVELFDINEPWVSIDGTDHSRDQTSLYYAKKIKKQKEKRRKS
ncbi:MAG: hypothetical protein HPY60_10450 [Candidatus Methanofastidiosum sp.]|nr:hypothetical protein [Methanofastidiosum sp.]